MTDDHGVTSSIATSIVHSKLDYCNSLFLNLDSTQKLQLIKKSLERAVTRTFRHHHITPVLKSLHWLNIPEQGRQSWEVGGLRPPDFEQGVMGGRGLVVKYYYILSCTGSMFESSDF